VKGERETVHHDILTFRHGFGLVSKDALKALLWAVVRIVRGLLGPLLPSCRGIDVVVVGVTGAETELFEDETGLL
jgi:hypothetical protein